MSLTVGASQSTVLSPQAIAVVATQSHATTVPGQVGNRTLEMMLDAGYLMGTRVVSATSVQVVSAVDHPLIVVWSSITPVILGIDFMQAHGLVLHFTTTPVHVTNQQSPKGGQSGGRGRHVLQAARKTKARVCVVQETSDLPEETLMIV